MESKTLPALYKIGEDEVRTVPTLIPKGLKNLPSCSYTDNSTMCYSVTASLSGCYEPNLI